MKRTIFIVLAASFLCVGSCCIATGQAPVAQSDQITDDGSHQIIQDDNSTTGEFEPVTIDPGATSDVALQFPVSMASKPVSIAALDGGTVMSGSTAIGADGLDPYTGNVTRTITDISVAGSPSVYPLALVRTANSRTPSVTGVFGWEGGWNHNYNWTMEDSPATHTQNFHPVKYTVNFPDGRVETFRAVTWDTVYRVRPGADVPAQSTSAGVSERFLQLNLNNMYAYLILRDGGAVEFRAQQYYDPAYGRYWYQYHLTAIYDPYGLKTTIDFEVVGQAQCRRITKVTEPAGRYLQFYYTNSTSPRIDHVTEYINGIARRSVQYYYTYTW